MFSDMFFTSTGFPVLLHHAMYFLLTQLRIILYMLRRKPPVLKDYHFDRQQCHRNSNY